MMMSKPDPFEMHIEFESAHPELAAEYIRLRGLTRENAVSERRLRSLGITAETWAEGILSGELQGFIARSKEEIVGYCFGNSRSGEVVVLAVLPPYERQGIGRRLLDLVVEQLRQRGHTRVFLGCSPNPEVRSFGFYRHLGWHSTGKVDERGDEILEFLQP